MKKNIHAQAEEAKGIINSTRELTSTELDYFYHLSEDKRFGDRMWDLINEVFFFGFNQGYRQRKQEERTKSR